GGVDEHRAAPGELVERAAELACGAHRAERNAEDARERAELLGRAHAMRVREHEPGSIARHRVQGGDLRDRGGLAGAGRADEDGDPAGGPGREWNVAREAPRERRAARFAFRDLALEVRRDRAREPARDAARLERPRDLAAASSELDERRATVAEERVDGGDPYAELPELAMHEREIRGIPARRARDERDGVGDRRAAARRRSARIRVGRVRS